MPVDPGPTRWAVPSAAPGDGDLVAIGADLEPATLIAAYRAGLFPMRVERGGPLGWWSPDPRGVLPVDGIVVSRSLQRSCRRFDVTVDVAFDDVVAGCADPSRPHGWIDEAFAAAYGELHRLGWAHSVEVWSPPATDAPSDQARALVGGLYGVAIGGLFAAESKFHRARDASKVAVVALAAILGDAPDSEARVLDVQWTTPHLESLGAFDVPRPEYLARVEHALDLPLPVGFDDGLTAS